MDLNKKKIIKRNYPYSYFFIDGIFDDNTYQDLHKNFPTLDNYRLIIPKSSSNKNSNKNGKWIFDQKNDQKWNQFCSNRKNKNWYNLIKIVNSEKFLNDLKKIFYEDLKVSHKEILDKKWIYHNEFLKKEASGNFQIMEKPYIQFSKMENGSFLEPHKDAANKIFTLIFYFPSKDWILNNSKEGGTKIYEVFFPEASLDFRNIYYKFSKFTKLFDNVDYKSNRLMGFIKDKKSYHSVGPVECKELVFRDSFIVNISAKNYPYKTHITEYIFKPLKNIGKLMLKISNLWENFINFLRM